MEALILKEKDMDTSARKNVWVRKRDGRNAEFDATRIVGAMEKAFRAELNLADAQPLDSAIIDDIEQITARLLQLAQDPQRQDALHVEQIQDAVEVGLMERSHFHVARRYILYRSEQARVRAVRHEAGLDHDEVPAPPSAAEIRVEIEPGVRVPFDQRRIESFLRALPESQPAEIDVDDIVDEVVRGVFDGITPPDIARSLVLSTRSRIERDPAYDRLAAALQLSILYRQTIGITQCETVFDRRYRDQFEHFVIEGIRRKRLSAELRSFELSRLADSLDPARDRNFQYLGVQTIHDRYLLHANGRRLETPQFFWMRVAMGLALAEPEESRTDRALEFYELLSTFRFTSATPTLFNSGTCHPQLSSCYLTTVSDDLQHIFKSVTDNAMLSKWAGGLGNDWTNVRATGADIKGTNGKSQGIIPFLKVVNDAAVAVNQGGKRKGAVCTYLEPWHLDFEEFLDLRKNTGDERRRTHDMHTAAWIPDLFMQRVRDGQMWTMFSPDETPDLHDTYGEAFKHRFEHYEQLARDGRLKQHRQVPAVELWRKLLTRTFETGHPWVTFKDPSNVRSPQDHCGVVHSSNLCTEILLNTSESETAVCNLGSVNLAAHIIDGQLDKKLLEQTVRLAVRMLDNVIDINFYPTNEARYSNLRHRPIGLGLMGFQDALQLMGISFASDDAVKFADRSMEAISYYAILASTSLAMERGRYETFPGSKWDRGLLPIDTVKLLEEDRGEAVCVDQQSTMDWQIVRDAIRDHGMRNSNCLAIAPTATISAIIGVSQSIEPSYKQLYAKSNLSGDFIQVNTRLVDELKAIGLWNEQVLDDVKYYDGMLGEMPGIPSRIKELFPCSFEIEPEWIIQAAARRQKWIDQGQSLNLYLAKPSGKAIDAMYQLAWRSGLKTTYYLRSLAATQVEKSTLDVNRHGIQPRWMKSSSESGGIRIDRGQKQGAAACRIDDPDCEACQ